MQLCNCQYYRKSGLRYSADNTDQVCFDRFVHTPTLPGTRSDRVGTALKEEGQGERRHLRVSFSVCPYDCHLTYDIL